MKYKVGDKVRIHTKEWFEKNCRKNCIGVFEYEDGDNTFVSGMTKFCGQEITINNVDLDLYNYRILEDEGQWYWEDWMFEDTNDEDMNNNINTISNPNIVEDFAKLIGVELGEEFYSKESSWCYKFTVDSGLMVYDDNKEDWRVASAYPLTVFLKMVKEGKFIKKWTPKDGTTVYLINFNNGAFGEYYSHIIFNSKNEYHNKLLESNMLYKTKEEAIEAAKEYMEQMKEGK